MVNISPARIGNPRIRRLWATTLFLSSLAACSAQADRPSNEESRSTNRSITLWQAVELLTQQVPLTKEKVEKVLSTTLLERDRNEYVIFFRGKNIQLADQVIVQTVDLRVNHNRPTPGFLVLDIDGACISLEHVRTHYGNLKITGIPRGQSLEEATAHTSELAWGSMSFGFKERNPKCLSWIAFEPKTS